MSFMEHTHEKDTPPLIRVTLNGRVVTVAKGTRLSDILEIEKPCGGHGTCGKCRVRINGLDALACRHVIESEIEVETYEAHDVVAETGVKESGLLTSKLCYALDIGTTTLALALVSLDEGRTVKVVTATNPQRRFGADVISRIDYCRKSSVRALQEVLIGAINRMIAELGATADIMYVSANTTMLHTFFGVDCTSIGVAPYTPAFLASKTEDAQTLGLTGVRRVVSLPSVSSFVGADLVAGLHLIGMPAPGQYNLLIDLGTNAEAVLYSNHSGVATAAAAGPCFEGANISCGMSATKGAICAFSLDYGHASYQTIGGEAPVGICGTGLIDVIAALLQNGIIDETGAMDTDYTLAHGVTLTREDVRQYQLAKSAVYSAILTLLKTEGIGFDKIATMYISGGFSTQINVHNAMISGLFPRELARKAVVLRNSSLQGTVRYACEGGDLGRFTDMIQYVDLSKNRYFSDLFVKNMLFEAHDA